MGPMVIREVFPCPPTSKAKQSWATFYVVFLHQWVEVSSAYSPLRVQSFDGTSFIRGLRFNPPPQSAQALICCSHRVMKASGPRTQRLSWGISLNSRAPRFPSPSSFHSETLRLCLPYQQDVFRFISFSKCLYQEGFQVI